MRPRPRRSAVIYVPSIHLHRRIDASCPGIDTAHQVGRLIEAVMTQPGGCLSAPPAVMADHDDLPILRQFSRPLGQRGEGNAAAPFNGAQIELPWLPHIEQSDLGAGFAHRLESVYIDLQRHCVGHHRLLNSYTRGNPSPETLPPVPLRTRTPAAARSPAGAVWRRRTGSVRFLPCPCAETDEPVPCGHRARRL